MNRTTRTLAVTAGALLFTLPIGPLPAQAEDAVGPCPMLGAVECPKPPIPCLADKLEAGRLYREWQSAEADLAAAEDTIARKNARIQRLLDRLHDQRG